MKRTKAETVIRIVIWGYALVSISLSFIIFLQMKEIDHVMEGGVLMCVTGIRTLIPALIVELILAHARMDRLEKRILSLEDPPEEDPEDE